jgi:thiopurine S-methyltransferase
MSENNQYWLDRWDCNDIDGFCQESPNESLVKHFSKFKLNANSTCMIPMCGNSIDIMFFVANKVNVVGIELSEKAAILFFKSHQLQYSVIQGDKYKCYQGDNVSIYVADVFDLPSLIKDMPLFDIWYDRGAYIALPDNLRYKYAKMMVEVCSDNIQILLLAMTHDRETQTPPFSISQDEINANFMPHIKFKLIDSQLRKPIPNYRKAEGMTYQYYNAYIRN